MDDDFVPSRRTFLRLGVSGFVGAIGYSVPVTALDDELRIEAADEVSASGEETDPGSLGTDAGRGNNADRENAADRGDDAKRDDADGKTRVVLSFDDSVPSAKSVAKPIMDHYGYPGVIGVVTERTEQSGADDYSLTVEELREIHADGWEVASHTVDHAQLTELSDAEVREQCHDSRAFIAENDLLPSEPTIVYPYGAVDDRVADIAAEYYEYGFGGDDDPANGIDDSLEIERSRGHQPDDAREGIDEAIANDSSGVAVLMFHRIGTFDDPSSNDVSRAAFADLMEYLDERDEEIEVVTASEL